MGTPYKMKGNPMQRNFGSPLHAEKVVKTKISKKVEVKGGKAGKSLAQREYDAKILKQAKAEYADKSTASSVSYDKLTDAQKLVHKRAAAERAGRVKK